jgi:hypothetical protein
LAISEWACKMSSDQYHQLFDCSNALLERKAFWSMRGIRMARKTVLVCDNCGVEVEEGRGATLRVTFTDARRGAKAADLCDGCAGTMPGTAVARRGRKPKSLS